MKLNLAALAVLLGTGAAFATSVKPANVKWHLTLSGYEQVTAPYRCNSSANICTATYPEGQDPNIDASNPVAQETGTFQ